MGVRCSHRRLATTRRHTQSSGSEQRRRPLALAEVGDITSEVIYFQATSLGCATADRETLQRGSAVSQQVLESTTEVQVQLRCSSLAVVERYVHCISSEPLIVLPESINNELIELYCFAALLKDGHVQALVLARWPQLSKLDPELALDLENLNLLFDSTNTGDPARNSWTASVCAAGVADRVVQADGRHEAKAAKSLELVTRGRK
jgi:hypothetical protein